MSLAQLAQPLPSAQLAAGRAAVLRVLVAVNVAGLVVAGLWLRVWELGNLPGINGDEAWYGIQAMRLLHGEAFAWRTPTNNLLNPFFFGPLLALHTIWTPGPELLRIPAVVSGMLALPLNYWLCGRVFDRRTALITTAILAVLPVNIGYSRFGWDASQTLLATLPAVYLPLLALKDPQRRERWLIFAGLAFLASLLVHPTNIFTAPLIVLPLIWASRGELLGAIRAPRPAWQRHGFVIAILVTIPTFAWLGRHWLATIAARLLAFDQLAEFAWNYQRLFSGLTVYRYLAGSLLPDGPQDVVLLDAAWLLIFILAVGGIWRLRSSIDGGLLVGWGVMLTGFFLVAGPSAIAPHYERYGICLIAPGAVLLGRGLSPWLTSRAFVPRIACLLLGWLTLLGFHQHYFAFIHRTGGQSHETFRTAAVEPKQAALKQILEQRDPGQVTWIVTAEYWNELPLEYLAAGLDQLRVENWTLARDTPDLRTAAKDKRTWFVEFAGSERCEEVRRWLAQAGIAYRETNFGDYAGRPVLTLFAPAD